MENITFFVERYGVIAVFLNVLLDEGGLPLPSYPLLAIAGALSVGGRPQLVLVLVPHRRTLPDMAASISSSVGFGVSFSSAAADMIWPDWQ
jgi:hypothetical protein